MGCASFKSRDPLQGFEIFTKYNIILKLGSGTASQVHEATHRLTGDMVAIKCVVKKEALSAERSELHKEANIMRKLQHENVCRLYETFEDEDIIYFVLELCAGGKLLERLESDIVLEEVEAARVGREIASAVAYFHAREIVHRDLKPENWLLSDFSDHPRLKLVNFGLAEVCSLTDLLEQPCGTLHYVAPEVLRGRYGHASDMWTLGVVMFLVLYASYPFDGESCTTVMSSILGSEPDWANSCYVLSEDAKNFLKLVLAKDPAQRLSASEALQHPWLTRTDSSLNKGTGELIRNTKWRQSVVPKRSVLSTDGFDVPVPLLPGAASRRCSAVVTQDLVRRFTQNINHSAQKQIRNHPFAVDSPVSEDSDG